MSALRKAGVWLGLIEDEDVLANYENGRRSAAEDVRAIRSRLDGHPVLADLLAEAELMREAVDANVPVLGVCLGAHPEPEPLRRALGRPHGRDGLRLRHLPLTRPLELVALTRAWGG